MRGDDRGNCLSPARPLKGAGWRETVFGEFFGRIGDFRRPGAAYGAGMAACGCGRDEERSMREDRRTQPDRIWRRRAGMGTPGKGRQACGSSVHDMITKGKGRGWRFGVREARSGGRLSGCPGRGVGGQVSTLAADVSSFRPMCPVFGQMCPVFGRMCPVLTPRCSVRSGEGFSSGGVGALTGRRIGGREKRGIAQSARSVSSGFRSGAHDCHLRRRRTVPAV